MDIKIPTFEKIERGGHEGYSLNYGIGFIDYLAKSLVDEQKPEVPKNSKVKVHHIYTKSTVWSLLVKWQKNGEYRVINEKTGKPTSFDWDSNNLTIGRLHFYWEKEAQN